MAGTKGRSGGSNKKSIADLRLSGTYVAGRHDGHELDDSTLVQPEPSITGDFTVDRAAVFNRFASILHEQQLTSDVDSFIITQITDTYCAYVQVSQVIVDGGIDAQVGPKLAVVLQADLAKVLRELLGEFRLTPSTRAAHTRASKVVADDPIASFMGSKPTLVK